MPTTRRQYTETRVLNLWLFNYGAIRIGNDITIIWKVKKNGEDAVLNDKRISLDFTHPRGQQHVVSSDYTISGNTITIVLKGEDQRILGPYTLTLGARYQDGKRYMIQDKCKIFELVGRSCAEDMDDDYYTVEL